MAITSPLHWRAIQTKYANFTTIEEQTDYDHGRADAARRTSRSWNEVLDAGERRIISEIQSDADAYKMSFLDDLETTKHSFKRIQTRLLELSNKKTRRDAEFTRQIHAIEFQDGRNSSNYENLRNKYEKSREIFDELWAELKRPPREGIGNALYALILIFAFIIEIPLNATALQLMSSLYNWYDWVQAIFVGFIFVFFVHLQGVNACRMTGEKNTRTLWLRGIAAVFLFSILMLLIGLLAFMRDQALHVLTAGTPTIAIEMKSVTAEAAKKLAKGLFGSLSFEAVQLLIVNFIAVMVTSTLAFLHSDPDERYGRAFATLRRNEHRFFKVRRRLEDRLAALTRLHNEEIATFDRLDAQIRRECADLEEQVKSLTEVAKSGARFITSAKDRRLAAYRQGFLHGSGSTTGAPELEQSPPSGRDEDRRPVDLDEAAPTGREA